MKSFTKITAVRLMGLTALLMSFTILEAAKIGLWNDTDIDVKVTLKKNKGKEALKDYLVKARESVEPEDANTTPGSCFNEIRVTTTNGVELNKFKFDNQCGDIAFRIFTGAGTKGEEYYTSRPSTSISELKTLRQAEVAEETKALQGLDLKSDKALELFYEALSQGNMNLVKGLIAAGLSLSRIKTERAFSIAKDSYTARELIKLGFNINEKYAKGETLLLAIAGADSEYNDIRLKQVQNLLDAGADVNAKDNIGRTALDLAMWMRKYGGKFIWDRAVPSKMEKLLKKYGAKLGKDLK